MIAGWLAATAVTTGIAYVAVGAAGESVTERPLTVVNAEAAGTTSTSVEGATTEPPSTTAVVTSSPPSTPSTTSPSSTTSGPSSTSSTTTSLQIWQTQTISSAAGTVVVAYQGEEVRLESVAPLAGYSYDVDKAGPDEVRVEFDGPLEVEVRARVRDGQLSVEISEDS
jgi:cytoskeletal protein RodZ